MGLFIYLRSPLPRVWSVASDKLILVVLIVVERQHADRLDDSE